MEFFTNGWIAVLSAPAVGMLLVLVRESGYSGRSNGLWFSPGQAVRRFGLSADTRNTGLRELARLGIVDQYTKPVSPTGFDMKRRRNVYDLHLEQLSVRPGQARPAEKLKPEQVNELLESRTAVSGPEPASGVDL